MSGHSKWATIKRQKAVTDAKRGAVFTKLGSTIAIAARGGADPATNFALRPAIEKARAANMPMANVRRLIDRGSGKLGGAQIQEDYMKVMARAESPYSWNVLLII